MSKLSKAVGYLVGPIDFAADDGVEWRRTIRRRLEPLGIKFIDPTDKVWDAAHEIGAEKKHIQELKKKAKFKQVKALSHLVRQQDLRYVDISDFVIAHIDTDVHMCGTYEEIFRAENQNKPRFVYFSKGRVNAPFWIFDHFNIEHMFDSLEDLMCYIEEMAKGETIMDDRWILIRDHI